MRIRTLVILICSAAVATTAHAAPYPAFETGVYSVVDKHFLKPGETAWKDADLLQDPRDGHSYFGVSTFMLPQPQAPTPFVVVMKKTGPDFNAAPYVYLFLGEEAWGKTCLGDEMTLPQGTWHNSQSCDDYKESPL